MVSGDTIPRALSGTLGSSGRNGSDSVACVAGDGTGKGVETGEQEMGVTNSVGTGVMSRGGVATRDDVAGRGIGSDKVSGRCRELVMGRGTGVGMGVEECSTPGSMWSVPGVGMDGDASGLDDERRG